MKVYVRYFFLLASLNTVSSVVGSGKNESLKLQYKVRAQDSLASAMMLGLANEDTAFIFDKVENNRKKTASGRPTWASLVQLSDYSVRGIDATTNPFCAAGTTLGNGSYIVVGGNSAISYGGMNVKNSDGSMNLDGPAPPYNDMDGRRVVRMMQPNMDSSKLKWIDDFDSPNQMDSPRWYPAIEGLADGSVVMIGGATSGGFINRNYPNVDPVYATSSSNPKAGVWDQGGANPSYEFWPRDNKPKPAVHDFMVKTSGLNMYAHTYLLPSGRIFMQANYSTTIWDWTKDKFYDLPDMPDRVIRVYPASGATAMLPLTPKNKYTPTILFCGGFNNATDEEWGDYTAPRVNMFERAGSDDCSSITPEDADGNIMKNLGYVREEKLPEPRSMGQFIHLPTGQMVIVNGASRGVAGYGNTTWNTVKDKDGNTVHLEGMSQMPTYRPVLYDPELPQGKRLEYTNYGSSKIARLYHSSAILVPDGSVLIAGSNPHMDVSYLPPNDQLDTKYEAFNTTYTLEQWYPSYYFEERPKPMGMPDVIKYGGNPFNISVDAKYMNPNKNANAMANNTKIMVIRPGFSTHAVNFGQRSLQLENSYVVNKDGSVTFIVNPMPMNLNIFVPGPALLFVTVNGIPSKGKYVFLGGKDLGSVPFDLKADFTPPLPNPVLNPQFTNKAAPYGTTCNIDGRNGMSDGAIAGTVIGVLLGAALLAGLAFYVWRNKRNDDNEANYAAVRRPNSSHGSQMIGPEANSGPWTRPPPLSDPSKFPLMQSNDSTISLSDVSAGTPLTSDMHKTHPSSMIRGPSTLTSTLDASSERSNLSAPQELRMMTQANSQGSQSYRSMPRSSRAPVLMPEQTHWNDIPRQMHGPRSMPHSHLQQHLVMARERPMPSSE